VNLTEVSVAVPCCSN